MSLELSINQLTLSIDTLISILEKSNKDSNSDLNPVDLSPKSKPKPKTKDAEAEDTTQVSAQPTPIEALKEVAVQLVTEVATEQSYEDIREAIKGCCKTLMEKNRDNKAKIMVEFNKFNATHVSKVPDKNLEPLLKLLMDIK